MAISRRSWAIICARISSEGADSAADSLGPPAVGVTAGEAPTAGGTANVPVAGAAATAIVGGAAPLPGNFTTVWHFGHFTLKARSGTFASSIRTNAATSLGSIRGAITTMPPSWPQKCHCSAAIPYRYSPL